MAEQQAGVDEALDAVVASLGGEHRDGQHRMASAVQEAIGGGHHLIVQAGTGTGKSFGYLVPAALQAVADDEAVVVATATLALQRQLVERDLPRMTAALAGLLDRPVTFAVLKGRNNYVCLNKLHGHVPEDEEQALFSAPRTALGEQVVQVRAWAESTQTGDRDEYAGEIDPRVWRSISVGRRECIGESRCPYGEDCFTVKRRLQAQEADIVVTNHAMLAIDALEGIPVLPEHGAVVIDEGHELIDRATAAVTAELSLPMIERAISRARRLVDEATLDQLQVAAEAFDEAIREACLDATGPVRLLEPDRGLILALTLVRDACHQSIAQLGGSGEKDPDALAARQHARAAVEEVHDTAGSLLAAGEHDVVWIDPGELRSPAIKLAPLSVAGLLRDSLFSRSPVVITSATLATGGGFDALVAGLGLQADDVTTMDVGSPFDHARQGILYVARHLPAPGRDGVAMEALDHLAELIEAAGGRTLALFSSWRGVERAADYLRVQCADIPLLVQRRGDAVGPLVDAFASDPRTCLLGTVSLWQGVDVPGDSCILVAIDRIPFPRPDDPLLSARQQAVDEAGGSGFRAVAVPRAGLLLAQGSGRLIRGAGDRGVVAVLDSRLATAGYASALRASMPPFWYTTDRSTVLASLARLRDSFEATPGAQQAG
ncbi:MAG: ATP-dependent DNA helicase [Actinomycetales bacterium]|nr:ATP-dependent DNA helicase [Actinomycetales bacterium]